MKNAITLLLLLLSISIFGQTKQHFSIYGGKGFPIGKSIFDNYPYQSTSLFANMSSNTHFAFESEYLLNNGLSLGYSLRNTRYSDWEETSTNNRFANASLNSFDIGFIFGYKLNALSSNTFKSRILLTPFTSYLRFRNPNSSYFTQSTYVDENNLQHATRNEIFENAKSYSQLLPGLSVVLEYAFPFTENTGGFVRGGITAGLTKSGNYPDKYFAYPSVSLGLSFNKASLSNGASYFSLENIRSSTTFKPTVPKVDLIKISEKHILDFCFSPRHSKVYFANDSAITIWDMKKRVTIGNLDSDKPNQFTSLDISDNENLLVAASHDGLLTVWSLLNSQVVNNIQTNRTDITQIHFSAKGSIIIVSTKSGELIKYNTLAGTVDQSATITNYTINSFSVSDSLGLIVATTSDGYVVMASLTSLSVIQSNKLYKENAADIAFLDTKNRFYSCGSENKVYMHTIKADVFTSEIINKSFGSGNINSIQIADENVLLFSSDNKGYIFTHFSGFKFKSKLPIRKLRTIKSDDYIIVAYSTADGFYIVNSLDMESTSSTIVF